MRILISICLLFPAADIVCQTTDTVDISIPLGYTEITETRITNAVGYLGKEDFNKGYIPGVKQLFQGKVAGLSISRPGSNPNEDFYTRIRGLSTINGFDQPLFVIDGIPGGYIDNLDPDDIESVTILKDAASCSVYGVRGAAGIILITTKSGNQTNNRISLNSFLTLENVARNVPVLDADSWRRLSEETGLGTDYGSSTDWFDEIEQNAVSQIHNLAVEGGKNQTSWRFSLNYKKINGILKHSGYDQLNGRIHLVQTALKDRIRLDIGIAGTEKDIDYSFNEAFHYAPLYNPTSPVHSDLPEHEKYGGYFQQLRFDYYNPVSIIDLNKNKAARSFLEVSAKASVRLADFLSWDTRIGNQNNSYSSSKYYSKYEFLTGTEYNGIASRQDQNANARLFETVLHYSGSPFRSVDADFYTGYSFQGFMDNSLSASVNNFLIDQFTYNNLGAAESTKNGLSEIQSGKSSHRLAAFFGSINLSWKNWLLNGSFRYEGSSRLGRNKKWTAFPSFGMAYKLQDKLKFRMSYGIAGNLPVSDYTSLELMQNMGSFFPYGTKWLPIYGVYTKSNPDLQAELKREWDFGIDFALFNSRLHGTFDYYRSTATNLLMKYYNTGMWDFNNLWLNSGEIQNSGKELTLDYILLEKQNFSWRIHLNAAWGLKNKLVSMTGIYDNQVVGYASADIGFLGSPSAGQSFAIRAVEGEPVGQLVGYVYDGIDPTGVVRYKDIDENGWIDNKDLKVSGNGLPGSMSGLAQSVTYKNWNFDVFFRGVFGHSVLNSFRALYESADMFGTYNIPESILSMKNEQTGAYLRFYSGRPIDIYVEKASFIALDHVAVSYLFKSGNAIQNKLAIYLAGNNLFYVTKYKGADPNPRYVDNEDYSDSEVLIPGIDRRETWSRTRSFTMGFRLTFD